MMNQPNDHREIVAVTGSSGLIGAAVVRRLASSYRVIGFDRPGLPQPPEEADAVDIDLASDDSVRDALRHVFDNDAQRLASVIHLAAYYDFAGEPSPLYEQVTVRGTERLLNGLRELGFTVEQFVFSSTMLVHAPCEPGQAINEDWPIDPKWDYPRSKVRTEQVIRELRGDIPAVLLRIAGVYNDQGNSIPLVHQMQRIFERQLTGRVYPGSTSHGQAFVHLDDVVEAIWLTVQNRRHLPPLTVLLIGEDRTLSYDELQHTFAREIHGTDASFETQRVPKTLAKVGAWVQDKLPGQAFIKPWMIDRATDHYELDITRARNLLGWEPKRSLRDTLPKMVESLKRDPLAWYQRHELEPPNWLKQQPSAARHA
ncbi:NAD-dependent epimerase/dehydratase family protein [Fontivita pretiosa]|uniref:NAD-dependent epimerase/dehydratase family protein n=1 Tax=Fontivita pretiosa TaxID=2989684 RepID=UPI003D16F495